MFKAANGKRRACPPRTLTLGRRSPFARDGFYFARVAIEAISATGHRHGWALATGAALLLLVGAVLPPFVDEGTRLVVRQAFAPICHQLPARSFSIGEVPLAACHRCFGIYAGLVAGTLAWPLLPARVQGRVGRRAGWLVLAAGLPAALDWGAGALEGLANTPVSRTATGGLLGMAMGLLFARATAQALGRDRGAPTSRERSSRPF